MSLAIKNSLWIHHIEIPGSYGTAINTALADNDWRLYFMDDSGRNAGVPIDPQHWHTEVWSEEFEEVNYKINQRFAIMINPWHRTINSFNSTMRKLNLDPSVDTLNNYVRKGLKQSVKRPFFDNNTWRPQSEFIDDSVRLYDTNRIGELITWLNQLPGFRWHPKYNLIPENDNVWFDYEQLIPDNQLNWYTNFEDDWLVWCDKTNSDPYLIY